MRPIDADELLLCYEKRMDFERHRNHAYLKGVRDCIKELEYQPTIDSERKKGKWIVTGTFCDFLKCSCCGYKKPWNQDIFNFCPNCGVEME